MELDDDCNEVNGARGETGMDSPSLEWLYNLPVYSWSTALAQVRGAPAADTIEDIITRRQVGPAWLVTFKGAPFRQVWFGGRADDVRASVRWWLRVTRRAGRVEVAGVEPIARPQTKRSKARRRRGKAVAA